MGLSADVTWFGLNFQAERDGSNEFANYQPGSLNTTDTLVADLDNYDMVFHIGDMPYANGYLSQWDQFTAQVAPISARKPYMIARYCPAYTLNTPHMPTAYLPTNADNARDLTYPSLSCVR